MGPSAPTLSYLRVVEWAEWHLGVVDRGELLALGVSIPTIASWLRTGRLRQLHPGVYAVGHSALRREGRWRAAVLSARDAALTHHTGMLALGHWAPEHEGIHLTTPHEARGRGGLHVHRSVIAPEDLTRRLGLRVTRLERTLVDLADVLSWAELAATADRLWTIDLPSLRSARERAGRRTGRGRSRQLIEREEPHTRSEFERAYLRFVRRQDLPRPEGINERVGRYVVDMRYPGLALELDGRAYHARRREMAADRHRDADLQALGYRVMRLVWEDLYDDQAAATASRLRKLLALRGA